MFGHTFKRYEIREELGIGGMATVYRAYDPSFEREVALKVLKREWLQEPLLRERFERETKIVAKLEHAAIVPVYDVDFDNNQLFYVMRHMRGGTLTDRIEKKQLDMEQVAYILLRLADALDYAHSKGIVHRDLKPGNILFDEFNNAYISDFGIAKFAQAANRITDSGIIGTPRYMSPEQANGAEVDGRSDQYALGVIMFELLTGQPPFDGTTPLVVAYKHATEPAPNILDVNPDLPPELGPVFNKILEKNPNDRYSSLGEFANRFFEALPPSTLPLEKLITPLPPRPNPLPKTEIKPTSSPTMHPLKPRVWMIIVFMTLVLLGLSIWEYARSRQTPASLPTPIPATVTKTLSPTQTSLPTATNTSTPTASPEPTATIFVDPGIGGATHIALIANREVYLMDLDGSNIKQLTNTNIRKFDLQWLPDGKKLLYGEDKCVYTVDTEANDPQPEKIGCYTGNNFVGFRVSPDGKYAAISIENRLIVLPFDLEFLSTAKGTFELQNWDETCIDYSAVTVRGAQWSTNSRRLVIKYQSLVNNRLGDTIRILEVDLPRCRSVRPVHIDEFPGTYISPEGYEAHPILPYYHWDGDQLILFNTYIRNSVYGELYLFDLSSFNDTHLAPVGSCCYRSAILSPDGTHMLFLFQDINQGAEGEESLYYMPLDGSTEPVRIKAARGFFSKIQEDILFALQPSRP